MHGELDLVCAFPQKRLRWNRSCRCATGHGESQVPREQIARLAIRLLGEAHSIPQQRLVKQRAGGAGKADGLSLLDHPAVRCHQEGGNRSRRALNVDTGGLVLRGAQVRGYKLKRVPPRHRGRKGEIRSCFVICRGNVSREIEFARLDDWCAHRRALSLDACQRPTQVTPLFAK